MKKFFTRLDIQKILESNNLSAKVSYMEREGTSSPQNYIVYYRMPPNNFLYSDDSIHIANVLLCVNHYHKKKLDSIENLMTKFFQVLPIQFSQKQLDTDFFCTYYQVEILTSGEW